MTIQEAKKYLEENPKAVVIAPNGFEFKAFGFDYCEMISREWVFGEWKVKREPRVVWMNEYQGYFSGPFYSKEEAERGSHVGRIECVKFVEVIE